MNKPTNFDEIEQVIVNGKVYDRYVAGEEPEGKVLLLALPLSSKTDKNKDGTTFTYWAKIGNFNKGVPIANDFNLLVRANPPANTYKANTNSEFAI